MRSRGDGERGAGAWGRVGGEGCGELGRENVRECWAGKLRTGPARDFGLGFQGMLGWVWAEFLGFFSILFPLSFLFLNQSLNSNLYLNSNFV